VLRRCSWDDFTLATLDQLCRSFSAQVRPEPPATTLNKDAFFLALLRAVFEKESEATIRALYQNIIERKKMEREPVDGIMKDVLEHLPESERGDFSDLQHASDSGTHDGAPGPHAAVSNTTPAEVRALVPPGSVIVMLKQQLRLYEGCHRAVDPHRWVSRRFDGVRAGRTETEALWQVVDTLWNWHLDTGRPAAGLRPTMAQIAAAVEAMSQAVPPAPEVAAAGRGRRRAPRNGARGPSDAPERAGPSDGDRPGHRGRGRGRGPGRAPLVPRAARARR